MKTLWVFPPSKFKGEIPLVSQNRWFKYLPFRTNFIYPVIASYGITRIKEAGYDIDFIDCPTEEITLVSLLMKIPKYDLIIMEGRTAIITWIWELTLLFKVWNPNVKIALYGDHVMVNPTESLQHGVDYIVHCGDYDYGVLKLIEALTRGYVYKGVFQVSLIKDLDELPYIDRDFIPWKNYFETWRHKEEFGWIQSGRGCPFYCTFCSWVYTFYHHTLRTMTPERVVSEIDYATGKWGIKEYLDDADTFLTSWGLKFSKELTDRNLDIFWNMQTRADQILLGSVDDWKQMKRSGLHVVKLGIDGGNDATLKRIRKGYDWTCVEKAVKRLQDADLEIHINMIIGYPWETVQESYDILKFVKKLNPNQAQFSLIEPFVGTPIFEEAIKNDWFVHDPYDWDKYDMKTPILKGEMNTFEIAKLHRDAWKTFYFNPKFMLYQLGKQLRLAFQERNLDGFRHLWRGFKGVYYGHMKAVN